MQDPRGDQVRDGYAGVARAYREQLGHELDGKPLDRAWLAAFVERCTGAGAILDIGCGPGHIAKFMAGCDPHARVHAPVRVEGVDLSPAMIAEARAAYPELAFRVADMFALPHADASVAGIAAMYAIVHLRTDELAAPLREFRRVVAPGGVLTLAFHCGREVVHVDELFGVATSLDFVFHEPADVIAALTAADFTLDARLDREPYAGAEHASKRCYLLARA